MSFWNNIYLGKITSCHTQAIFNAYFSSSNYDKYLLFEILTTNSFGVQYISNDPNRILDSYLDFDLGLDRAFELLNMDYRISYNKSIKNSLKKLRDWLKYDNVVVGPLNMEDLPYLYYPQLYKNLDHYLVVKKYENNKIYLLDLEGIASVSINEKDFIKAWSGDNIIEGRGKYIMRQILKSSDIDVSKINLNKLYQFIIDNLLKARQNSAYKKLAQIDIKSNTYLISGFSYALPNRLQKLYIQKEFFKDKNLDIVFILDNQIEIFNKMLSQILEKKELDLNKFLQIDKLENYLLNEIKGFIK